MGRSHLAMLISAGLLVVASAVARAESLTDFEDGGFAAGESVNQHEEDGTDRSLPDVQPRESPWRVWSVQLDGTDEAIVDLTEVDIEHGKVWRLSNATTPGRVLSPHDYRPAGEITPEQAALGVRGSMRFRAELAFRSATGAAQPGLHLVLAAASGDSRQAELHLRDAGDGLSLSYVSAGAGCEHVIQAVASGLAYDRWHSLVVEIGFVQGLAEGGTGNDVLRVLVDGATALVSTSWEGCVGPQGVDRLVFEAPASDAELVGGGLFLDDVHIAAGPAPATYVALDAAATCPNGEAVVRVSVDTDGADLDSLDTAVLFDDDNLLVENVFLTEFSLDEYSSFYNVIVNGFGPDTLDTATYTGDAQLPVPGEEVLWLLFHSTGAPGTYPLGLVTGQTAINEETPDSLVDGAVTVGAADVRLAVQDHASGASGSVAGVLIHADPAGDLNAFDLDLRFDPLVVTPAGAQTTPATAGFSVITNPIAPGRLLISLYSADPIPPPTGEVAIVQVNFNVVGALGQTTALDLSEGVTDDGVTTCLDDGWFEVCLDEDEDGLTVCLVDPEDCDDDNPSNFTPLVGDYITVDKPPVDQIELTWSDGGEPGPFRLYRGFRDAGNAFDYNHVCLGVAIPGTTATDAVVPVEERTFYYLVSREGGCGESGLGFDSLGTPRPNDDPCASTFRDLDGDGVDEALDNCPNLSNPGQDDDDGDGDGDDCDNCSSVRNPNQANSDGDAEGDVCDPDDDDDLVPDGTDNCPYDPNAGQDDGDSDGVGDDCDPTP